MAIRASDLLVHLDAEYTEKLARLAEAERVTAEALADKLLRSAIDRAQITPESIEQLIDSTPGLYERIQESRAQGRAGRTIPLSELRQT